MKDCKQNKEEALDENCSLGYVIVFVCSASILGFYLVAVYLSIKGVDVL